MNREEKNENVRENLVDDFASTRLCRTSLEKRARLLDGHSKTPLDDLIHVAKSAGTDLTAMVTDPGRAALYVDTESAVNLILSIGLIRMPQFQLKDPATDKEREERDRAVTAHRDAGVIAREVKSKVFTIEKFQQELAKVSSPELVRRMLFSPTAGGKIVTADGKTLDPINLPTKKLNSEGMHRVRISVAEVSHDGMHAMVRLTWAEQPGSVALKGLFKRPVRLDFRRFKEIGNLSDLLLSLRLARREAEVIVSVTRALRTGDKDLDLFVLKEFCGLKELAAAVPEELQRIQEELWSGLR